MPRYNITFRASNGEAREITGRAWADTDDEAKHYAISKLAVLRATVRAYRSYDEWEVWQGVPPYTAHKTVATGRMQARA